MSDDLKIYRGNIAFAGDSRSLTCIEGGYILVRGGKVVEVRGALPEIPAGVTDFGDRLIIPAFVDLHVHAPQFENIGLGLDKELLAWLKAYTFPEERKFEDLDYAKTVYARFADGLARNGTTRASVFATVHTEAAEALAGLLDKRGIGAFVGRVNMDRNADYLNEDTETSLRETEEYIKGRLSSGGRARPIITPRFTPSCSAALMRGLGELAARYNVPVQSHLSESRAEIEWVRELEPESAHYADTYDRHGLFGDTPTVMAHCVYPTEAEIELMREKNVFAAHCPASNLNVMSGIAPVRKFLRRGINVGFGSDVSGGNSLYMPDAIVLAIQSSKMYSVLIDEEQEPLTLAEAFYMATKGGGKFFAPSPAGSFEPGYDFDALVIDDSELCGSNGRTVAERVERFIYTGGYQNIHKRFAFGKEL